MQNQSTTGTELCNTPDSGALLEESCTTGGSGRGGAGCLCKRAECQQTPSHQGAEGKGWHCLNIISLISRPTSCMGFTRTQSWGKSDHAQPTQQEHRKFSREEAFSKIVLKYEALKIGNYYTWWCWGLPLKFPVSVRLHPGHEKPVPFGDLCWTEALPLHNALWIWCSICIFSTCWLSQVLSCLSCPSQNREAMASLWSHCLTSKASEVDGTLLFSSALAIVENNHTRIVATLNHSSFLISLLWADKNDLGPLSVFYIKDWWRVLTALMSLL